MKPTHVLWIKGPLKLMIIDSKYLLKDSFKKYLHSWHKNIQVNLTVDMIANVKH